MRVLDAISYVIGITLVRCTLQQMIHKSGLTVVAAVVDGSGALIKVSGVGRWCESDR